MSTSTKKLRTGASAVVVVMLFAASMVVAIMSINLANIQRHHSASQIATDLGTRWGVDMLTRENDLQNVENQVKELVTLNSKESLSDVDIDVSFGSARSQGSGWDFLEGQYPTNAVKTDTYSSIGMPNMVATEKSEIGLHRTATAVALERDICLVVDRSGSMNFDLLTAWWSNDRSYHPYNPLSNRYSWYYYQRERWWRYWPHPERSRWSSMIPAIYELAEELKTTKQQEMLSIVSYSTTYNYSVYAHDGRVRRFRGTDSAVEYQPTQDYSAAVRYLDNRYKWHQPVAGGTNISAGIDRAAAVLTNGNSRPNAFKTMIVMTDGQYNAGRPPWLAAEAARQQGIEVFTVTFSHQADQVAMEQTADWGGGMHFHAPDGESLTDIFKEIANTPPSAFIE